MKSIYLATAFAVSAMATPAFAQDSVGSGRAAHFDGPYVSVYGGVSVQPSDYSDTLRFDTNGDGNYGDTVRTAAGANAFIDHCNGRATTNVRTDGCSRDKDRAEYGVRLGYDKRMGDFVVGGLIEYGRNDKMVDGTTGFSGTPAFYEITRGLDHALSARLRAGFTPGGGVLFYGTGGVSAAKLKHGFRTTNTVNTFTPVDADKMVWGYQFGGGAEAMLGNNVSVGLEYLFNRYKDNKYHVLVGPGTAGATNPFVVSGGNVRIAQGSENFTFHSVRATLNFRF